MESLDTDGEPAVVLIADAVQDPGNFGTLVRTVEALGARGVVSLPGTVDAWNPKAVRAAVGSSFRIPIVYAGWEAVAPWLGAQGLTALAAAGDGEPLGDDPPRRAGLIVGNEGAGISPESRARADRIVSIPLRGRAESLNVAAATAILLHQLLR
jgi:TrmH family RNA methyltransferase